jgi:hypothetical protein
MQDQVLEDSIRQHCVPFVSVCQKIYFPRDLQGGRGDQR